MVMVMIMILENQSMKIILYSICALLLLSGAAYGATVAEANIFIKFTRRQLI